jgi:hypothetical protein
MIAEALIPVFFVMFLGYFAGARRIIDNQQVASLTVLVMTFALPARALCGGSPNIAQWTGREWEACPRAGYLHVGDLRDHVCS